MQGFSPDATTRALVRARRLADTDMCGSSDYGPPTPSEMFTRIGVLLVITLGFALAAQLLVAMTQ
jgi:hypothetical protein